MQIDWFTFAAQIINFLILVGLLHWLLYQPITRAMAQREQRIADRLQAAAETRSRAEAREVELNAQLQALEQTRQAKLAEAHQDAQRQRKHLLAEARTEVDRRREQWTQAFHREQRDLMDETHRQTTKMGFQAAHRTLQALADEDLQTRMCRSFAGQLHGLDAEQRQRIADSLPGDQPTVVIRSAMPLAEAQRSQLGSAIHARFNRPVTIEFEVDSELICGLELDMVGYRLSWNAASAIEELEQRTQQHLTAGS